MAPKPVTVLHWLTVVTMECTECKGTVQLVGAQVSACRLCGTQFASGGLSWDSENQPTPAILIGRPVKIDGTTRLQ